MSDEITINTDQRDLWLGMVRHLRVDPKHSPVSASAIRCDDDEHYTLVVHPCDEHRVEDLRERAELRLGEVVA